MSHSDPIRDYDDAQQEQDLLKGYLRCLELYQMAERGFPFDRVALEDLRYHLGLAKEAVK